ncbi:transmembrane protein 59-like [Liolophura sinensis]|uniref:transmembrane protein 59-like n=1 Tax=Liolophura sinensis TaxID=3198878 RepID=UPI003157FAC4
MAGCRVVCFLLIFTVLCLVSRSNADLFDTLLRDASPCVDLCTDTYSPHTNEKSYQHASCRRGCRLFSIMEFLAEQSDANVTKELCHMMEACYIFAACSDAYDQRDDSEACQTGCSHQQPLSLRNKDWEQPEDLDTHFLYPLMYVHSFYSNMFDKVKEHMTVQWSLYMQQDNGQLVVVQSQPREYIRENLQGDGFNTPFHLETNLFPLDSAATPDSKRSQLRSIREDGPSSYSLAVDPNNFQSSDWLSCISSKTGLPRLILTGVVLLSAGVMIWLCLTAANTAPDHHVKAEKLSINGDLEYLKEAELQKIMSSLYPQDPAQASALPIKIRVERV